MISVNWKRWTYSSQDNNYKCTMDLSSPGGTVALLGTPLVNSCFSLLLRHTERHNNDEDDDGATLRGIQYDD